MASATIILNIKSAEMGCCHACLEPSLAREEGWDSGWTFLAGDGDEEYSDDSRNFSIYDLNILCN